jgi:hypothetical protein
VAQLSEENKYLKEKLSKLESNIESILANNSSLTGVQRDNSTATHENK